MKKLLLITHLLMLFGFIKAQNVVRHVDANTFQKLLDTKNYVLIDLRTTDEINSKGLIEGAIQIDYLAKDSEKKIEQLSKNTPYLIYCAGGGRSSDCAELMRKLGFTEVVNLEKGFDNWKKQEHKTIKK